MVTYGATVLLLQELQIKTKAKQHYLYTYNIYTLSKTLSDQPCQKKACLYNADIKSIQYTSIEACITECQRTEGCVALTAV